MDLNHGIDTGKVTKPLQLLAAWLIGLILTNGSFLAAATRIERPDWAAGLLIVAAVLNVPIFLGCLFLLQTRFRPEMQEDQFYSTYLATRRSAASGKEELVLTYTKAAEVEHRAGQPFYPMPSLGATEIQINDLLPHFIEISEELSRRDLKTFTTFGSTSAAIPPDPFIVTVEGYPDIRNLQKVVQICMKYGLVTVTRADAVFGNRIYIGAYTNKGATYNPTLIDLVANNPTSIHELNKILPRYESSIPQSFR